MLSGGTGTYSSDRPLPRGAARSSVSVSTGKDRLMTNDPTPRRGDGPPGSHGPESDDHGDGRMYARFGVMILISTALRDALDVVTVHPMATS